MRQIKMQIPETDQNHVWEKHSPPPGKKQNMTRSAMLFNMTGWSVRNVQTKEEQRSGWRVVSPQPQSSEYKMDGGDGEASETLSV